MIKSLYQSFPLARALFPHRQKAMKAKNPKLPESINPKAKSYRGEPTSDALER